MLHLLYSRKTLTFLIALFSGFPVWTPAAVPQTGNANCLRCHGMATFGYLEPGTGMFHDLSVAPENYAHSTHSELSCRDCHKAGYDRLPHPESAKREALKCLDCHRDDPKFKERRFPEIGMEFEQSVHAQKVKGFSCFNCHDPHAFDPLDAKDASGVMRKVEADNRVCLSCHDSAARFKSLTVREFPEMARAHAWLPKPGMHWRKVRCLDCHTSYEPPNLSHRVLPKERAVKDCVKCHRADSVLLTKLYRFEAERAADAHGFLNGALWNNAYVVGATRNLWLERALAAILALTLLGIAGHGAARFVASRGRRPPATVRGEYLYPAWLRAWHWSNAALFLLMALTGFHMHFAGDGPAFLSFAASRAAHNGAAILLLAAYLFFLVANVVSRNARHYYPLPQDLLPGLFRQARYYLAGIFRGEPHPFDASRERKFNPLQQVTYLSIMYLLYPAVIVTGIFLLFPQAAPERIFGVGGIAPMALGHLITSFFGTVFLIGHLYLATTGPRVFSLYRGMFTGYHEHEAGGRHEGI